MQYSHRTYDLKSSLHPALMWYELQPLLETADFDVLLVLDCCYAAGAVTKGAGSTAGCSREERQEDPDQAVRSDHHLPMSSQNTSQNQYHHVAYLSQSCSLS
jgi:hypothetical protein